MQALVNYYELSEFIHLSSNERLNPKLVNMLIDIVYQEEDPR